MTLLTLRVPVFVPLFERREPTPVVALTVAHWHAVDDARDIAINHGARCQVLTAMDRGGNTHPVDDWVIVSRDNIVGECTA